MSSIKPIRDPKTDHLLTPENSALLVIDYQPIQVHSIASMDRRELVENYPMSAVWPKGSMSLLF